MNLKALLSLKMSLILPVDTAQHPGRRWGVGGGGLIGRGPQIRSPRSWQLQLMPKRQKIFIPLRSVIPKNRFKMLLRRLFNGHLYFSLLVT
jgi:hypothetical protein